MRQTFAVSVLLSCLVSRAPAQDVVYSSFGPSNEHSTTYEVVQSSPTTPIRIAVSFTVPPLFDYQLSSIEISAYRTTPSASTLSVQVNEGPDPVPSFIVGTSSPLPTTAGLITIQGGTLGQQLLRAGRRYWIQVSAAPLSNVVHWMHNNVGITGDLREQVGSSSTWTSRPNAVLPAIRVKATMQNPPPVKPAYSTFSAPPGGTYAEVLLEVICPGNPPTNPFSVPAGVQIPANQSPAQVCELLAAAINNCGCGCWGNACVNGEPPGRFRAHCGGTVLRISSEWASPPCPWAFVCADHVDGLTKFAAKRQLDNVGGTLALELRGAASGVRIDPQAGNELSVVRTLRCSGPPVQIRAQVPMSAGLTAQQISQAVVTAFQSQGDTSVSLVGGRVFFNLPPCGLTASFPYDITFQSNDTGISYAYSPPFSYSFYDYVQGRRHVATGPLAIVPGNTFVTAPGSTTLAWRTTAFRSQFIYDTTHFTGQGITGPIVINGMRFRAADASTAAGGVYANVNVLMGTSAVDYLAPSTLFASNRSPNSATVFNGIVAVAPGAGTSPNTYVIDIQLTTPFVFDPTLGADLLIEIDAPAPSPTSIPSLSSSSNQYASRSVRVGSASQTALSGSISGFAPVILFNFSGGTGGFPSATPGLVTAYGTGCYPSESRAFGELFPVASNALDLGGGFTMTPLSPGAPIAYSVTSGAGAFVAPTVTAPLLTGDDQTSQALNLISFSFPFVGGSTSVLHATTNGEIVLGATAATGSDFSPSLAEMAGGTSTHAGLPRLFPCWHDLHAGRNVALNPLAGLHFQEDTGNQTATITWYDVGEFATTAAGAKSFNFQVVLRADGNVEYRYGSMSTFGSTTQPKIVGATPGAPVLVPASQDLSATMPFVSTITDVQRTPLSLEATPAPILGATTTLSTRDVPAPGAVISLISTFQIPSGLDLGILGMPGCRLYLSNPVSSTLLTTVGTAPGQLYIPNNPSFAGLQIFVQSAAVDASLPNPLGIITSNALALTIGIVR